MRGPLACEKLKTSDKILARQAASPNLPQWIWPPMAVNMKVALISTVYNEADSISRWIEALKKQTVQPDEFVIVDGGSKDETVRLLQEGFDGVDFPKPRIIVQRCNIAEGRNIAIGNCSAEIIATLDAGSAPEPDWLAELTKPFGEYPDVGVVGGACPFIVTNEFQKMVVRIQGWYPQPERGDHYAPSSRNAAFRRSAWEAAGGYPEWLTLTAEDLLFNASVAHAGVRFYFQPSAKVGWENRPDAKSYLKMMRSYGFGCGEARVAYKKHFRWLVSVLVPPVLLFSKSEFRDLPFRYLCNFASVRGWLAGYLFGRKPPAGWERVNGMWISPQAIAAAKKARYDAAPVRA